MEEALHDLLDLLPGRRNGWRPISEFVERVARLCHSDALHRWVEEQEGDPVRAPPSFFKEVEELKDVPIGYQQFHLTIATFDIAADSFQGIGLLGADVGCQWHLSDVNLLQRHRLEVSVDDELHDQPANCAI